MDLSPDAVCGYCVGGVSLLFKALGVFLFAVEIGWFIVRPIIKEMAVWRELPALQNTPLRPRVAWLIPLFAVAILFVPWQAHLLLSGLLSAETQFTLYSPQSAKVQEVLVKEGDSVQAGQVLIELNSPDLDFKAATAERHLAELKEQLAAQSLEVASAQHNPIDMEALQSMFAELIGLREAQKNSPCAVIFQDAFVIYRMSCNRANGWQKMKLSASWKVHALLWWLTPKKRI